MKKKMQQIAMVLICIVLSIAGMAYQIRKYQEVKGISIWSYFTTEQENVE